MRPVRLATIALQAERHRLQYMVERIATRAGMLAAAGLFVLIAFLIGEAAVVQLLSPLVTPAGALGIVAGFDLLVALVLFILGSSSKETAAEREAHAVALAARQSLRASMDWTRMLFWGVTMFRRRRG